MLTYLTMSLVLTAPALVETTKPTPVNHEPTVPQIIEVKSDDKGKLLIPVSRATKADANGQVNGNIILNGGGVIVIGQPLPPGALANLKPQATKPIAETADLSEIKDLKIRTVSGKEVSLEEARKMLAKGGLVIAPADGKKINPKYLKLFAPEVLIFMSSQIIPTAEIPNLNEDAGFGVVPGAVVPRFPAPPLPVPTPVKD